MIDFEAEYNNRARVPEHPQIFAAWVREAAQFRAHHQATGALDLAYGAGARQRFDFFPAPTRGDGALLLFIHGGYWQSLGKSSFSHLAQGPNIQGLDVVMAGYTLCPEVTIDKIVEEMQQLVVHLARRFNRPMVVAGHSAGGHLAAILAASDWTNIAPDLSFDPVSAAMPISGVYELEPLIVTSINSKLGLDEASAEALSPRYMTAPRGKRLVCVVGGDESSEFLRQQRAFVDNWGRQGAIIRGVEVAGAHHFTVIDPLALPDSDLTKAVVSLSVY